MQRRDFIKTAVGVSSIGIISCGRELLIPNKLAKTAPGRLQDIQSYAFYQAFYGNQTLADLRQNGDGTNYKMPIIKADDVYGGREQKDVEFWHSHGQIHRWSITQEHYAKLLQGETVYIFTTEADGHWHCAKVVPKFA